MNPTRAVAIVVALLAACEQAPSRFDERTPAPGLACQTAADCVLATTPASCAEGACVNGQCKFKARDADGDTFRAKACKADDGVTAIELGTDCDDTLADVNPQGTEVCNNRDDNCAGGVDEGIDPQGTCSVGKGMCARTGKLECKNGSFSKCNATPGTPQPDFPRCDGNDYACDGPTQVGCSCTVGSSAQGTGPAAGWNWCPRNCDSIKRECAGGKLVPGCAAVEGEQPQTYCRDNDHDGYYDPNSCQELCGRHSIPQGAPAPLVGLASAPFVVKDGRADCNDGRQDINPVGRDTCTEDRNCNGRAGDGLPKPGSTASCSAEMCGYSARKTVQSNCTYGACALTQAGINSATFLQRMNCTGSSSCGWEHAVGGPDGNGWKVEASFSSDWVVTGPGKTLPAGDYTVNFVGAHWTSSTWLDVNDLDGGPVPPAIHLEQGIGAKSFNESISFHAQPCHRYQFRVHGNHFWAAAYGMKIESITLTRN